MIYEIKELKYNSYYMGCYDYSEFNDPYYIEFSGCEDDAHCYYMLEHALKDVELILKHDSNYKAKDLVILIATTGETLTIDEAISYVILEEFKITDNAVGKAILNIFKGKNGNELSSII